MERGTGLLTELVTYGVVSAAALALDAGLLLLLVRAAHWHYIPASIAAFTAGAIFAYVLSVRFVFRFRKIDNRALELGYFIGMGLAGMVVNAAMLSIAITLLGLDLLVAKLLAAACTFLTNFSLRRAILFSPRSAS